MKMRSTALLQVCLYISVNVGAGSIWAASPANGLSDPYVKLRTMQEAISRMVESSKIADLAILERARAANKGVYSSLESFVCREEINRYKGDLSGQSAKPVDTVSANLSFEGGVEQYSNIYQNNHLRHRLSSLNGAWSEGEFGTLLLQTQQLLFTRDVSFQTFAEVKGEPAAIFYFDVGEDDSPWELTVAGYHYRLPFRTSVWIALKTGEILKIDRITLGIAPETEISEIQWGITLDHFTFGGKTWLLPSKGTYAVLYNDSSKGNREWNLISFSGYQHYGSEAAIKFE